MRILAYHMVEPRFDISVTRVTPRQFERQIECAVDLGFTFQTLSHTMQNRCETARTLVLTFDDAYASIHRHALPILQKRGIVATVFVVAGYVGKFDTWDVNFANISFPHMDWQQIGELSAAGWEVGSHTLTHRDLTRLPDWEMAEEIRGSKVMLEEKLLKEVNSVSYPFGKTNLRIAEECRAAGYRYGVVMGRRYAGIASELVIPRLGIYLYDTSWLFQQKIVAKDIKIFNFMQRCTDFCSRGTVLVRQGWRTNPKKCA